jgi:hypothetical protein
LCGTLQGPEKSGLRTLGLLADPTSSDGTGVLDSFGSTTEDAQIYARRWVAVSLTRGLEQSGSISWTICPEIAKLALRPAPEISCA